jgi:hypothetical protein
MLCCVLCGAATAQSQWHEFNNGGGDAGELPGTAQVVAGSGPLTSITGVHDFDDTDMYEIEVANPGVFRATVSSDTDFDTQLFLFDEEGLGVAHHDDVSSTNRRSRLTNMFVQSPGRYYLAISAWNRDPAASLARFIWNDAPSQVERAPDGQGAGDRVENWLDPFGTDPGGAYTLQLEGVNYVQDQAPCPGDLNGDGIVGLSDLTVLLANYGTLTGADPGDGDLDGDGDVDLSDLTAFLSLYGVTCP